MKKFFIPAIVVAVLIVAVVSYWFYNANIAVAPNSPEQSEQNGQEQQRVQEPENKSGTPVIEMQEQSGIFVCVDKCGDGICQPPEKECDNLNCVCLENPQECPADCK